MRFEETPLRGAWVIEPDRVEDERGYFARTYDRDEFAARGIELPVVHCNTSLNDRAGTLRGMHLQVAPHGEPKLVRCTRGAIYDVIVDLRPDSPTHLAWFGAELSEENGRALYAPVGLAHGFQTLRDASEVLYMMGHEYIPSAASGVRWDDPAFAIAWPPASPRVISERDASFPDYRR
ncbi:MAG: dTDP-4-dehydrorhamnose 3,5-epimerase [Solirubrobacteraceae bacterium]|jgi:dTDP-4-dehydrorhamnose 3,5-epimerase|nr:dTDP-4-dehydrorhamnose 3,5-epimerase [Solirubrobacteraceae bacterium]